MIYVLLGPSCSGKSTVYSSLMNLGYKTITRYTTRPIRPGEINGVDYYFVTKDEFRKMDREGKMIAKYMPDTVFGKWYYGLNIDDIDPNKQSVIILEPSGYKDLIKHFGMNNVTGIYLSLDKKERYKRSRLRNDNEEELRRRIESDEIDFKNFNRKVDFTIDADFKKDTVLDLIKIIIGEPE